MLHIHRWEQLEEAMELHKPLLEWDSNFLARASDSIRSEDPLEDGQDYPSGLNGSCSGICKRGQQKGVVLICSENTSEQIGVFSRKQGTEIGTNQGDPFLAHASCVCVCVRALQHCSRFLKTGSAVPVLLPPPGVRKASDVL